METTISPIHFEITSSDEGQDFAEDFSNLEQMKMEHNYLLLVTARGYYYLPVDPWQLWNKLHQEGWEAHVPTDATCPW